MNVIEFTNDDDEYVAYGTNKQALTVYMKGGDRHYETTMLFPSCLKFMDGDGGPMREMGKARIHEKFGEMVRLPKDVRDRHAS